MLVNSKNDDAALSDDEMAHRIKILLFDIGNGDYCPAALNMATSSQMLCSLNLLWGFLATSSHFG